MIAIRAALLGGFLALTKKRHDARLFSRLGDQHVAFGHRDPVAVVAIEGLRHDDNGLLRLSIIKSVGAIVHRVTKA